MKINLKPVANDRPELIKVIPSRRFKRVGHSLAGHKYVSDQYASKLVVRTIEEQSALLRAIENRLFNI